MKFLRYADIWPGKNNGVLVEKETTKGKVYQATLYKEEYGSLQYSRGYDDCEQNMNDC